MIDDYWCDKQHLKEASYGTDLYSMNSLYSFHQEGDDGEENCGQESIEQAKTWASIWFLWACGKREKKALV